MSEPKNPMSDFQIQELKDVLNTIVEKDGLLYEDVPVFFSAEYAQYLLSILPSRDEPPHVTLDEIMDEVVQELSYGRTFKEVVVGMDSWQLRDLVIRIAKRYVASQLPSPKPRMNVNEEPTTKFVNWSDIDSVRFHAESLASYKFDWPKDGTLRDPEYAASDYVEGYMDAYEQLQRVGAGNPNHIGEAGKFEVKPSHDGLRWAIMYGKVMVGGSRDMSIAGEWCESLNGIISRLSPSGTVPLNTQDAIDFGNWLNDNCEQFHNGKKSSWLYKGEMFNTSQLHNIYKAVGRIPDNNKQKLTDMGMQKFISDTIAQREALRCKEIPARCPNCNRPSENYFRDFFFQTLQCPCGVKFYVR